MKAIKWENLWIILINGFSWISDIVCFINILDTTYCLNLSFTRVLDTPFDCRIILYNFFSLLAWKWHHPFPNMADKSSFFICNIFLGHFEGEKHLSIIRVHLHFDTLLLNYCKNRWCVTQRTYSNPRGKTVSSSRCVDDIPFIHTLYFYNYKQISSKQISSTKFISI